MGISEAELSTKRRDLGTAELISLDSVTSSGDDDGGRAGADDRRPRRGGPTRRRRRPRTIARERFRRAFSHLSERERRVAVMLYTAGAQL